MKKTKIYCISNFEVVEAEARETKKMFILDNKDLKVWSAFGYKTNFSKNEVFLSPLEAINSYIKYKENQLEYSKLKIKIINTELDMIKELKKKTNNCV